MIEDTPYIIVDNQKLHPVNRAPKIEPASSSQPDREEPPFGVVDRVTISKEALERYRLYQTAVTTNAKQLSDPFKHQQITEPARIRISDLSKK